MRVPLKILDEGAADLGLGPALGRVGDALSEAHRLGLGLKNSGLGNGFKEVAKATVRFTDYGRVEVRHCWTEMGQGGFAKMIDNRRKTSYNYSYLHKSN